MLPPDRHHICGFPMAVSQTGEEYVALHCIGDDKYATKLSLGVMIREYLSKNPGDVYWRTQPEVTLGDDGWKGCARLLASDKPMRWRTYEQYEAEMLPEPKERHAA